jgi:desulfoferrodoxin-like iron-binding protein
MPALIAIPSAFDNIFHTSRRHTGTIKSGSNRLSRERSFFMGAIKDEIYKCEACGNVVMVLEGGDGDLVCCGEDMKLLTSDQAKVYSQRMSKPGSP